MKTIIFTSVLATVVGACVVTPPDSGSPVASVDPAAAATPPVTEATAAVQPAPAITVLPFDEAVRAAADGLFSRAQAAGVGGGAETARLVVIDPLIDGVTGFQSVTSRSMETRITDLLRARYQGFDPQPFTAENVAKSPIVLVGTFTGVNSQGKTEGLREAFRICLALADLRSGKVVAKAKVFADPSGVDITPSKYFSESPAWVPDEVTQSYISTCQGSTLGGPIDPVYSFGILTAALINDAIIAFENGRYGEALDLYAGARRQPAGEQLRVYNGIYLANQRLGRLDAASKAFGDVVEYGLDYDRLAVKFLFKPGSTSFVQNPAISSEYAVWLSEIAVRTAQRETCLEITGHTSRTGSAALNERLSLLRAETIQRQLTTEAPVLENRTIANGLGYTQNIVGTGKDDLSDALDRRVEFAVISTC